MRYATIFFFAARYWFVALTPSLFFCNIPMNSYLHGYRQRLRQDIVDGLLQPDQLVQLSTSELATDEVKGERAETTKNAELARRSDLYEITRAAILQSNGIDPNQGGEFVCRRCKGTKTSHYALQTRSSDEPMTVFVCCLTCGNRWRCT
jgi:transcription elongation factor S-II